MKRFSAQYILTGTGEVLKRGIITTDDDGRITGIEDTGGRLTERASTRFYNGIIVPGFVNSHCHLELSHLRGRIARHTGLGGFVRGVREARPSDGSGSAGSSDGAEQSSRSVGSVAEQSIIEADSTMYRSGISVCGDICNSSITFGIKEQSPLAYVNFLEVFGIDPRRADRRIDELRQLQREASAFSTPSWVVPHSFYSLSATLLSRVKEAAAHNEVSSVHFMESPTERDLLQHAGGALMDSYRAMGIEEEDLSDRISSHEEGLRHHITPSGRLILVHNTFASATHIRLAMQRPDVFFCLCPASNLYIENKLPPADLLYSAGAEIVMGTDSLASNEALDILSELKILSAAFPGIPFGEMVRWCTLNGARAMGMDNEYGSIEKGKKPGLVLIENVDLDGMNLLDDSRSRRLI